MTYDLDVWGRAPDKLGGGLEHKDWSVTHKLHNIPTTASSKGSKPEGQKLRSEVASSALVMLFQNHLRCSTT